MIHLIADAVFAVARMALKVCASWASPEPVDVPPPGGGASATRAASGGHSQPLIWGCDGCDLCHSL